MTAAVIAIATCRDFPDLTPDDALVRAALANAGVATDVRLWDDPEVQWGDYRLVLIRSTWDYTLRRPDFLRWTRQCRRTANSAPVIEWNTDKRYLADLERAGVPVVPTTYLDPGAPFGLPVGWSDSDLVVKPTVSADARDTMRFRSDARGAADFAGKLQADGRVVMVQPYLSGIDEQGETALIYFGGEFSHAICKEAILAEPDGPTDPEAPHVALRATARTATDDQLRIAEAALAAVPGGSESLTYARVDLIPDETGRPRLLELELTEPFLFLGVAGPSAVSRLADAVISAAARD